MTAPSAVVEVVVPGPARPGSTGIRDPALDLLRAVALGRVVLWHMFGAAWMTVFAAMPLMFFVAGTLLGASGRRHDHKDLVRRRARRLLIPLWVYGAIVVGAGAVRSVADGRSLLLTPDALWRALTWVVPLADPSQAEWHGGWLSQHLWYLRAYLWIVLLAPLFVALARRLRVSLPLLGGIVLLMELAARHHVPLPPAGAWRMVVGDVVVYGIFVTLGIAYEARRRTPDTSILLAGALAAGGAALACTWWLGLPGGNVNTSYPAILSTGLAWLLAVGAARRPIHRVAVLPKVAAATRAVSRRAVTIYLWHPAAILVAYVVTDRWILTNSRAGFGRLPLASSAVVLLLSLGLTAVAVRAFGWIEGLAARPRPAGIGRRATLGRIALTGPATALALALVVSLLALPVADEGGGGRRNIPPPPSYREPLGDAAFLAGTDPDAGPAPDAAQQPGDLPGAVDRWRAAHRSVRAVVVGVGHEGTVKTAASTPGGTRKPPRPDDRYPVASLTKSFTLALALQQAEKGRIDLDAPVPVLAGLPPLPPGVVITPRQLIQHTSGLLDYSEATGFDRNRPLTPLGAVASVLRSGLAAAPGTAVHYSSTNYLYLGLLLERATGRSYAALLDELTSSLGLGSTDLDTRTVPGRVGYSAAGIRSTVRDLTAWVQMLFEPGKVVSSESIAAMTSVGPLNMGLGTWPICPCSTGPDGAKRVTAMGQYVADGGMYRFGDGTTVVVRLQPKGAVSESALMALGRSLQATLRAV